MSDNPVVDFLAFRRLISIEVLIAFYYLGALVMPLAMWLAATWLVRRYRLAGEAYVRGRSVWRLIPPRQRGGLFLALLLAFLFMELIWRLLFEYLIAYMQMRDALLSGVAP